MESLRIDISATRALTVEGRLVAGETAEVTIGGATPTALYLVAPDQTVVAACEAFTPTGEGSGGTGFLQLATEQVAALFAHTPAGRMVAVWALVNDSDGVAGAGWVPVVSAPMPDELIDLDIDFYLRASQVGAGLAIVDGKLVCTVNPDNYLTKADAAQTYATQTALGAVSDKADLAKNIADTAEASAQQANAAIGALATVAQTGSYNDLTDKPTIPTVPVQSVNGQTGAVVLSASDVGAAPVADLRYAFHQPSISTYITDEGVFGVCTLSDRAVNRVVLSASVAFVMLGMGFPAAQTGRARDFFVLIDNAGGYTGGITFTPPTGATVYGDGFTHSPASGETWLYSVTEEAANVFWCKSEKMEVAQ